MTHNMTVVRSAVGAVAGVVLALLAGCSAPSGAASGAASTDSGPVPPPVAVAVAQLNASPASVVESDGRPSVVLPTVSVAAEPGDPILVTEITVGGSAPIPVQIDTGSSGLVLEASAAGPATTTHPGQPVSKTYLSGRIDGHRGEAAVGFGPISTPTPVGLMLADLPADTLRFHGVRGILGVAPATGSTLDPSMPPPDLALPAPYGTGSTFDVPADGAGSWSLGPVTPPAGAQEAPLTPVSPVPGATTPAYAKDIDLCWSLGGAPVCAPTDLDSGAPRTAINATTQAALTGGGQEVAPGRPLSVTTPAGGPLWSFVTGTQAADDLVVAEGLGGTAFNTGFAFFAQHVVAWDYPGGRLLVAPKPTAAPSSATLGG